MNEMRIEIFGDATETFAVEAVWIFRETNGDWPLFEEAVEALRSATGCDLAEAERAFLDAVREDEIRFRLLAGGRSLDAWGLELDEDAAARVARRYLDRTMPRRESA